MYTHEWLIVATGRLRLAVAATHVAAIERAGSARESLALAALLGESSRGDEPWALRIAAGGGESRVRVDAVALESRLAHADLPPLLRDMTHPAVVGLALCDGDPFPIVDLVRLVALQGIEDS
jgi:hypothetical protein